MINLLLFSSEKTSLSLFSHLFLTIIWIRNVPTQRYKLIQTQVREACLTSIGKGTLMSRWFLYKCNEKRISFNVKYFMSFQNFAPFRFAKNLPFKYKTLRWKPCFAASTRLKPANYLITDKILDDSGELSGFQVNL